MATMGYKGGGTPQRGWSPTRIGEPVSGWFPTQEDIDRATRPQQPGYNATVSGTTPEQVEAANAPPQAGYDPTTLRFQPSAAGWSGARRPERMRAQAVTPQQPETPPAPRPVGREKVEVFFPEEQDRVRVQPFRPNDVRFRPDVSIARPSPTQDEQPPVQQPPAQQPPPQAQPPQQQPPTQSPPFVPDQYGPPGYLQQPPTVVVLPTGPAEQPPAPVPVSSAKEEVGAGKTILIGVGIAGGSYALVKLLQAIFGRRENPRRRPSTTGKRKKGARR